MPTGVNNNTGFNWSSVLTILIIAAVVVLAIIIGVAIVCYLKRNFSIAPPARQNGRNAWMQTQTQTIVKKKYRGVGEAIDELERLLNSDFLVSYPGAAEHAQNIIAGFRSLQGELDGMLQWHSENETPNQ